MLCTIFRDVVVYYISIPDEPEFNLGFETDNKVFIGFQVHSNSMKLVGILGSREVQQMRIDYMTMKLHKLKLTREVPSPLHLARGRLSSSTTLYTVLSFSPSHIAGVPPKSPYR